MANRLRDLIGEAFALAALALFVGASLAWAEGVAAWLR